MFNADNPNLELIINGKSKLVQRYAKYTNVWPDTVKLLSDIAKLLPDIVKLLSDIAKLLPYMAKLWPDLIFMTKYIELRTEMGYLCKYIMARLFKFMPWYARSIKVMPINAKLVQM